MINEQVFCGAEKCSSNCPAYDGSGFNSVRCKIISAQVKAENAKKEAYEKMKEYYSLKITNHE